MIKCDICANQHKRRICKICHEWDCFEEIRPISNSDRIRQMNDVELAKFIGAIKCNTINMECGYPACKSMEGKYCVGMKRDADSDILEWLHKKVWNCV